MEGDVCEMDFKQISPFLIFREMVSILLRQLEKLQLPQQIVNCCASSLNFYYPFRIQDNGITTCPDPKGIRD
jgi:hypothetical protein